MNQETIDRALGSEREITPSPEFARRVMRSVRTEAADREAPGFPWLLPVGGLAITAGLTLAAVLTGGTPADAPLAGRLSTLTPAVAWLSTALTGSLGVAWWSVRFAGR